VTEKAQRIGILLIVLIFVGSTIGVAIYTVIDNNRNNDLTAEQQKLIADAQKNANKENNVPLTCTTNTALNYTATPPLKDKPLPNFTPTAIPELSCIILAEGSGEATVKSSDTVTVNYTGATASNGTVFESSLDSGSPATFPLSGVIKGWTQGLPGMKVGETRRLLIPSALGYGEAGSGASIPPNSDLVFDVTLIQIGQ
jgi:FKBP-type peptidyl-prolyl cis-trans isomerase